MGKAVWQVWARASALVQGLEAIISGLKRSEAVAPCTWVHPGTPDFRRLARLRPVRRGRGSPRAGAAKVGRT